MRLTPKGSAKEGFSLSSRKTPTGDSQSTQEGGENQLGKKEAHAKEKESFFSAHVIKSPLGLL